MSETPRKGVLIEYADDDRPEVTPASAPPIMDDPDADLPTGQAMRTMAVLASSRPSRLAKFFWAVLVALIGFVVTLATWDYITGLIQRNPTLGTIALVLVGLFCLALLLLIGKEWVAYLRLARLDHVKVEVEKALASGDLSAARKVADDVVALYAGRPELRWGRERYAARREELLDGDGLIDLAEVEVLAPLDIAARREVEGAARQVAVVTAFVPLALADVLTALAANLRMIRRIAEIYGGRTGFFGSWRLLRTVLTHLVATGAVAAGDDLIEPLVGGGLLSKLSRRFGEGVVNGSLTARVGVAAMEVCRPLPFRRAPRPKVANLVSRALTGLFDRR
ncbi:MULTISPECIES: YcjF family protein [Haematobacter]|uniref:TIGR01620 family protein n=1 Tax=Haematobacter genomosp. 1 TaxID=366618 RepID=A0A212A9X6_9RHOB|nr:MULTISPECIES: TIGR01620 family protein [Haematobacter]OWJ76928.1 TIGR01620 family protein [Haematobacter genomosp. 1]